MQELDAWTDENVIAPLHQAIVDGDGKKCDAVCQAIKGGIRQRVLDSYHNGQQAGPKKAYGKRV